MESYPVDVEILVDSGAEVHVCPPAFGGALLSPIVPGRMTVEAPVVTLYRIAAARASR